MLRRVLLAALLCLSAWATADRLATSMCSDAILAPDAGAQLANHPNDSDASDDRWIADARASASLHDSGRRVQLLRAPLSGVPNLGPLTPRPREDLAAQRPLAPPRQHNRPLLI